MTLFDPEDQKTDGFHGDASNYHRRVRLSDALAVICLAVGIVCITGGQSAPGLILVFAAVAGAMTTWQLRQRSTGI